MVSGFLVKERISHARDLAPSSWLWNDRVLAGVITPQSKGVEVPEFVELPEQECEGSGTTKPLVAKPCLIA